MENVRSLPGLKDFTADGLGQRESVFKVYAGILINWFGIEEEDLYTMPFTTEAIPPLPRTNPLILYPKLAPLLKRASYSGFGPRYLLTPKKSETLAAACALHSLYNKQQKLQDEAEFIIDQRKATLQSDLEDALETKERLTEERFQKSNIQRRSQFDNEMAAIEDKIVVTQQDVSETLNDMKELEVRQVCPNRELCEWQKRIAQLDWVVQLRKKQNQLLQEEKEAREKEFEKETSIRELELMQAKLMQNKRDAVKKIDSFSFRETRMKVDLEEVVEKMKSIKHEIHELTNRHEKLLRHMKQWERSLAERVELSQVICDGMKKMGGK